MKKLALVMVLLLMVGSTQMVFAQGEKIVGGAANVGFPVGDWSNVAGTGFGATAFFLYGYDANIKIGGHVGYLSFGGDDLGDYEYSYSAIPILAEGRYYFDMANGPKVYGGAQVGFHIFSVDVDYTGQHSQLFDGDHSDSSTEFSFGPTVGAEFSSLDVSAFYMLVSDANYFGLRVGYGFPLGN